VGRTIIGFLVILVALLLGMPAETMAGGQIPSWSNQVELQYQGPDPNTGQLVVNVQNNVQLPPSDVDFSAINTVDPRLGVGEIFETLLDFQGNPGTVVLHVTSGFWDFDQTEPGPLPLSVYSYTASSQPAQLASPPIAGAVLFTGTVPAGDHSASPYDISLNVGAAGNNGGVCVLIETAAEDAPGLSPFLAGTVSGGSVPEPSSLFLMALGVAGVGAVSVFRLGRGRAVGTRFSSTTVNQSQRRTPTRSSRR
jgi:hypothetical protein